MFKALKDQPTCQEIKKKNVWITRHNWEENTTETSDNSHWSQSYVFMFILTFFHESQAPMNQCTLQFPCQHTCNLSSSSLKLRLFFSELSNPSKHLAATYWWMLQGFVSWRKWTLSGLLGRILQAWNRIGCLTGGSYSSWNCCFHPSVCVHRPSVVITASLVLPGDPSVILFSSLFTKLLTTSWM